ncbi:DUF445 domain-containing protein [Mariniluteicoccus endophyticus]
MMLVDAPGDAERREGLRRMRIVATSLLVAAALIWALTLQADPWSPLGFVSAAAEAAMVGALADWFAVTALFRHPLGIPIPHTALIKRRKDELGRSLQQFVTTNFLTEEIFRERFRAAHLGTRLATWLEDEAHRTRVLAELTRIARIALDRVDDDSIRAVVTESVLPRLKREPLSPIAGAFLEGIVADRSHKGLVDLGAGELVSWLERHPEKFQAVVGERAPAWSPGWVDRRVVDWGYKQALQWAMAVRDQPHHPARVALDDMLATLAEDLQNDSSVMKRAEALKERVLDHDSVGATVASLWASVRASLEGAIDERDSSLWTRGDAWLAELGQSLASDEALRTGLEKRVEDVVAFMVTTYGSEIATVISHTVESWDAESASRRIELYVGRDLQFIRINGTVVGALAGLVIHTVGLLLH